jgi:predicted PurR-regulated permease PerM
VNGERPPPIAPWLVALLCVAALVVVAPFAAWVVLGAWFSIAARRFYDPLLPRLGGRTRLTATITVSLLLVLVVPVVVLIASVVEDMILLVQRLMDSEQGRTVLERLASGSNGPDPSLSSTVPNFVDVAITQGGRAWAIVKQVAGSVAHAVIGLLILVTGMYGMLVQGTSWYRWLEQHAPMSSENFRRFADAFVETGRGLAFGIVGAGLLQSVVATITYVAIGVPSALALGMLTLCFSVIPAVGTAIVWVPVTAGLALTGRPVAAIVLGAIGLGVISTIDNLARPWLARRGQLQLPTYVVLISMFGGLELLGGWGIVLGPLIVRLGKEALMIRAGAALR